MSEEPDNGLERMLDESLADGRKTFSSVTCYGYTSG